MRIENTDNNPAERRKAGGWRFRWGARGIKETTGKRRASHKEESIKKKYTSLMSSDIIKNISFRRT